MNLTEIKTSVKKIKETAHNDERAHEEEDDLYTDFVQYVAKTGDNEQRKMARGILMTKKIDFGRWCM